MKSTFALSLLFVTTFVYAQQLSYSQWNEESKTNIRLLPKYGNVEKTEAQKETDTEFIKASVKQNGTREKASQEMVTLGFKYLYEGNLKPAMYRFNQAWLLDPNNEGAFWGFGAVYMTFGDFGAAHAQYDEGLKIDPQSSNILTDKATLYMAAYNKDHNKSNLIRAIHLFGESYKISPSNENTLFKFSVASYLNKDCSNALKYYTECKKIECRSITPEFEKSLFQTCK